MTRHVYRRAIQASPIFSFGLLFIMLLFNRVAAFDGTYFGWNEVVLDPGFVFLATLLNWMTIEVIMVAVIWAALWVKTGTGNPFMD